MIVWGRWSGGGRREFFYATPAEVREVLERLAGNHLLEYNETPEALEYRAGKTDR